MHTWPGPRVKDASVPESVPAAVGTAISYRGGPVTEAQVVGAIRECFDPEIPLNIYDLGLIYGIDIDESAIAVKMTLTSEGCPSARTIPEDVRRMRRPSGRRTSPWTSSGSRRGIPRASVPTASRSSAWLEGAMISPGPAPGPGALDDLVRRGFTRRGILRVAALVSAGAALPFAWWRGWSAPDAARRRMRARSTRNESPRGAVEGALGR
jgi:hypothetical protein